MLGGAKTKNAGQENCSAGRSFLLFRGWRASLPPIFLHADFFLFLPLLLSTVPCQAGFSSFTLFAGYERWLILEGPGGNLVGSIEGQIYTCLLS